MEEELLIIIVVVVIDAYKPPDSTGFEFMALTDWLRLLPASTPVCTKVVGGRVWTGISLSVSTIVHSHCKSSTSPPHLLQQKLTFPARVLCKHYIHTIQHASLFLRKDSRHTVQQTSQFLRKYYNNNNFTDFFTNTTTTTSATSSSQSLLCRWLFSLFLFFLVLSHLPYLFPKASQSSTNSTECAF